MGSECHFIKRSGWLRASVLGMNDGILSTTSLAIGVAAACVARDPIILATLAGVVAGALSMADRNLKTVPAIKSLLLRNGD